MRQGLPHDSFDALVACASSVTLRYLCELASLTAMHFCRSRFSPSAVRKVAEDVVKAVLTDKVWNGEDEAVWTVTITEQVKQRVRGECFI